MPDWTDTLRKRNAGQPEEATKPASPSRPEENPAADDDEKAVSSEAMTAPRTPLAETQGRPGGAKRER